MMFWRMAGLSTASPVETILDRENFTLEELLDEDEIIQECKALNSRLINFLRQRPQVEQLICYIVEEGTIDADKRRTVKFPFISCEIFTCEVDIILNTLVEDEELMNLLFSYLESNRSHSTLLAGYFSKVVICLLLRKTTPLMQYIQSHQDIVKKLVNLIGITSIMEVLIRLVGADEHIYTNYMDAMRWLEDTDVLDMIVDKFSSSDSPEVHANAAETLCAVTRYAPPGLATKTSSPGFIGRLFHNALEESRPKSVLVNSLTVCISLLDPKRLTFGVHSSFSCQVTQTSMCPANPVAVEGMLGSLGHLLGLLNVSSDRTVLLTTYGKLQPPLGKHRLKVVEFISVLLSIGGEAAENELMRLGAVNLILDLFFKYPFNNFLHHFVENITISCLESKNVALVQHILHDCNLVGKILEAEKYCTLVSDSNEVTSQSCQNPTVAVDERHPFKIGNIGHLTRISNKLVHIGSTNNEIQKRLQENSEWAEWHSNVLSKRTAVENVNQWSCGRPVALQERTRDSDDDDYQDRDYDVASLANNLSQAFRYGIYSNDVDEGHGSLERDDEDVYFDDESAEVVISSLRLGDDQDSGSIFTNTNWFAFDDEKINDDHTSSTPAFRSTGIEDTGDTTSSGDEKVHVCDEVTETTSQEQETKPKPGASETGEGEDDEPPEQVEWMETSTSDDLSTANQPMLPNGTLEERETQANVSISSAVDVLSEPIDSRKGTPNPYSGTIS